jgi:hypothetical protein
MLKCAQGLIGAVALTLVGAQHAWADVQIVLPGSEVAGQPQLFWAQSWWQWVLGIPASNNPLTDTTGQFGGVNNNGPVFFLAGNFGGVSTRTITVPDGKTVFFPVINSFYVPIDGTGAFSPFPPCATLTLTCAINAASFTEADSMVVQVDGGPPTGVSLDNAAIEQHRQTSTSYFSVDLPTDNVLGVTGPIAPGANLWTQDGFYITLDDLSVGTHVLRFQGEGQTFSGPINLDITDTLVVVPEPSTWAMMFVGFAGLGYLSYRASQKNRNFPAHQNNL